MDRENRANNGEDERDVENEGLLDGKEIERYRSGISEKNMTFREPLLVKRVNTTSQIAIVGSNVCTIESLDYEYAVSPLYVLVALASVMFIPVLFRVIHISRSLGSDYDRWLASKDVNKMTRVDKARYLNLSQLWSSMLEI